MSIRKLSKQVRNSLQRMVHEFALTNEKLLPESDRHILGAIYQEIQTADDVKLNITVGKDGKVQVDCNEITYKFNDPTPKDS